MYLIKDSSCTSATGIIFKIIDYDIINNKNLNVNYKL